MIILGISTQADVTDVWLHLSPAGSQFLYEGSASQDIWEFIHQLLKKSRGIRDTEGHDFPAEDPAFRGYKDEQFLPETTALVNLSFESAFSDSLHGVLHFGNTPCVVLGLFVDLSVVDDQAHGSGARFSH